MTIKQRFKYEMISVNIPNIMNTPGVCSIMVDNKPIGKLLTQSEAIDIVNWLNTVIHDDKIDPWGFY